MDRAEGEPFDELSPGRQALIRAGLKLFAERGFAAASVRTLAAEAGVSIGLVRAHFGSKDGLRRAVDAHALGAVRELYDAILENEAPMSIDSAVRVAVDWVARNRAVMLYVRTALFERTAGSQALFDELFRTMRHFVNATAARGKLKPGVDRDMATLFLIYDFVGPALVAPFVTKLYDKAPFHPTSVARRNEFMSRLFREGIFE
ncbi:MAG: TetR/AcrR family transcriptional regulator [Steroidobacteraceae bacterium]|jgi:AcrR family transcriptional regulator|nr:TetR/AcrR family transcriptional regulator [Steroidobacteraceae bacterium]